MKVGNYQFPEVEQRIRYKKNNAPQELPSSNVLFEKAKDQALKIYSFLEVGYAPHYAQLMFHFSLAKRRVLSAGRRGGKTLSAAKEVASFSDPETAYECLIPYGVDIGKIKRRNTTMLAAIVIPQEKNHGAAVRLYLEAIEERGLVRGKDFRYNKTAGKIFIYRERNQDDIFLEVQVKAVKDDPDKMRSEFYIWVWFDEPGFLDSADAWETALPALADYDGIAIFTTSPGVSENNYWFFDTFMSPDETPDYTDVFEWTSVDNPHLKKSVILEAAKGMSKHAFEREFLAKWNRPSGDILKPEWIHYYDHAYDPDKEIGFKSDLHLVPGSNQIDKDKYSFHIGIDPAITPEQQRGSDKKIDPDFTGVFVIAKDLETGVGYVVDIRRERIDFPAQVKLIEELNKIYRPLTIGIDSTAYMKSLSQFISTIPSIRSAQVIPILAPGSKEDRLPALGPIVKSGIIRFNEKLTMKDSEGNFVFDAFLDEFCKFPNAKHDDLLDALDITIRAGGLFANFNQYFAEELERDRKLKEENKAEFTPRVLNDKIVEAHWEYLDDNFEENGEVKLSSAFDEIMDF